MIIMLSNRQFFHKIKRINQLLHWHHAGTKLTISYTSQHPGEIIFIYYHGHRSIIDPMNPVNIKTCSRMLNDYQAGKQLYYLIKDYGHTITNSNNKLLFYR